MGKHRTCCAFINAFILLLVILYRFVVVLYGAFFPDTFIYLLHLHCTVNPILHIRNQYRIIMSCFI